jgi:hypothetical protein
LENLTGSDILEKVGTAGDEPHFLDQAGYQKRLVMAKTIYDLEDNFSFTDALQVLKWKGYQTSGRTSLTTHRRSATLPVTFSLGLFNDVSQAVVALDLMHMDDLY